MVIQRCCLFIPEIDSIIQVWYGKKASEIREIFNIIADILKMTTSREAKRAAFSAFILTKLLQDSEIDRYFKNNTKYPTPDKIFVVTLVDSVSYRVLLVVGLLSFNQPSHFVAYRLFSVDSVPMYVYI